jgi:hypothetical protein
VVEFHRLSGLAEKNGFELISLAFGKLLVRLEVVHAHVNNCTAVLNYRGLDLPPVMEFTFHRKDRSAQRTAVTIFPHPLDRANLPVRSDKVSPDCWRA